MVGVANVDIQYCKQKVAASVLIGDEDRPCLLGRYLLYPLKLDWKKHVKKVYEVGEQVTFFEK